MICCKILTKRCSFWNHSGHLNFVKILFLYFCWNCCGLHSQTWVCAWWWFFYRWFWKKFITLKTSYTIFCLEIFKVIDLWLVFQMVQLFYIIYYWVMLMQYITFMHFIFMYLIVRRFEKLTFKPISFHTWTSKQQSGAEKYIDK